jgi:hypothetical protein
VTECGALKDTELTLFKGVALVPGTLPNLSCHCRRTRLAVTDVNAVEAFCLTKIIGLQGYQGYTVNVVG